MNKIKTTGLLKKVMKDYFLSFAEAPKTAWCTSVGPAELLRSFGFEVYFPENHGALLGATRTSGDYIPVAGKLGFAGDICSYLTSDIGAHLSGSTPLTKHYGLKEVPKPDLIVYSTNQCREVQDWFTFFGKKYHCPVLGIEPPRYLDEVRKKDIENVAAQFKALLPSCEKISGKKFELDSFSEVLRLSLEATLLWKEVLATAKHSPAPLSFFDASVHMGPIVVLRGTQQAIDYYELLLEELENKVNNGIGFLKEEWSRVYWEGMPIWGKLRFFSELFINHQTAVVASTYCNSWVFDDFDEKKPFESSALAYTKIFINRSEEVKIKIIKELIEDFRIDGVVFHDAKTCFNNTNSRFGMPLRLKEETGIETLVIEGDLCDLRFFSEGQTTTKLETFIDQMQGALIR